jgi:hypothetical protein
MKHPIDNITWLPATSLSANHYNPNYCMDPELVLLERSLVVFGWMQPVLVQASERWIIDGFHRWRLAAVSKALLARDGGLVPCALLDLPLHRCMMMTVAINRAKGTHGAVEMSRLVRALIDEHGCDPQEVALGIGATRAEVDLLYQNDLFKSRNLATYRYSKAWVPAESGKGNPGGKKGAAMMAEPQVEREE